MTERYLSIRGCVDTAKKVPSTSTTSARADLAAADWLATLPRIGLRPPELAELFDYVQDLLFWTKDDASRFRWVNMPLVLNLGLQDRAQVIGRGDFDFFNPILANQYQLDDERALRGERVLSRIELIGRFDHTARWWVTSKIPLHGRRGRIVGTGGVAYPLGGDGIPTATDIPLAPAIRFISEHFAETISNGQLAKACGLSVRALERQFRATYHLSPHEYIRQLRVRMSSSALVYSSKSLAQLALEFGYADQSHFAKEFRRFFGENPSTYRARFSGARRDRA